MEAKVFVGDWQLQCCGDPFSVGSAVTWSVHEPDHEWLSVTLGETGGEITDCEEHHGEETGRIEGVVRSISAVFHRLEPGSPVPVPGSTVLREVTTADGYEPGFDGLTFRGYVVELSQASRVMSYSTSP